MKSFSVAIQQAPVPVYDQENDRVDHHASFLRIKGKVIKATHAEIALCIAKKEFPTFKTLVVEEIKHASRNYH
jgi:hypothetical protein